MVDCTSAETRAPAEHPADHEEDLEQLERLASLMDTAFRIPVINYRIGLDSLIGLVPVVGDVATLVPGGYILYTAWRMRAPRGLLARMAMNTGADAVLGAVPLIGDIFDLVFKSNRQNVRLLRRHIERRELRQRQGQPPPPA